MSESDLKSVEVKVFGIVQGVGFRYSTLSVARRLGVSGYVMNLSDGSVKVVAEGDASAIEKLISWLKHGPPGAYVRNISVKNLPYRGLYRSFNIEF